MILPTNQYLEVLDDNTLSPKSKIIVDGVEYTGNIIKEAPKLKHSSTKFIGVFPAKTLNFTMYDFDNNIDFENKEIEVYKGITVNGGIEYLKQGIFIPKKSNITTNISKRTVSFADVQDRTQFLDDSYVSSLDWSNNQKHSGLEIIEEICNKKNLILKNIDFHFANYMFKQPNFNEKITNRGVIAAIAEIGGEIAIFDSEGKLEIKSKNMLNHIIKRKRYEKLSYEKAIVINTVVLGRDGINNDIVYPETIETERVEIKIFDNPFVDLYREEMIEKVSEYLIGLSYIPFQIENFVDGYMYELNDAIEVIDRNGNQFEAIILNIDNTSRIKSNVSAPKFESAKTDYNLAGSNKESISKVRLDVDHINKKIEILAKDVTEDKTAVAKIEQDSENIKSSVTKVENDIREINESIELFSIDLSQYNLVIPTDKNNKPYSNSIYTIDFYGYFKGTQIIPNVTVNNSQTGVTASVNSKINFEVKNTIAIQNKNFIYEILFEYTSKGTTYSITKKISFSLALQGNDGAKGETGARGSDGTSSYFHVKYSKNSNGNPMQNTPNSETEYMGVVATTSNTPPTSYSAYVWSKIKGNNGSQGIPGNNGTSSYFHIKWSQDGSTFTPADTEQGILEGKTPGRWQGTYVNNNPTDSDNFNDYTWNDTSIYVRDDLMNLQDNINQANTDINNVTTNLKNNYLTSEEINAMNSHNENSINKLKSDFNTLKQTADQLSIEIGSVVTTGVNKVRTATGFTFDEKGLDISKDGEEMHNFIDNEGVYVKRDNEEVLGADASGVRTENLTVRNYFVIGKNSRFENYKDNRTGCFFVGGGS